MRHLTLPLATLALALASCGDATSTGGASPEPTAALAIEPGAQLHLVLTTQVTIEEYDVHDEGTGDIQRVSDAVRSEWWIAPDGTFVQSREEDGLLLETTVQGNAAWRRAGAVTADVATRELATVLASAEDLVCLLGWVDSWPALSERARIAGDAGAIVSGADRPDRHVFADPDSDARVRIETYAPAGEPSPMGANALATLVVESTRPVDGHADAVMPGVVLRSVPGPGRLTETRITIDSATILSGADVLDLRRPEPPDATYGEAARAKRPGATVVFSEHAGPVTDIPRLESYLRVGLSEAKSQPKGAFGLEFDRFPSAERDPALRMVVAVSLSRDRDAGDLPAGALTRMEPACDIVTVPYRGMLPATEAQIEPALAAARALGLEPDGPVRILLPDDLGSVEPGAQAFTIEVPVRERD